jgi:hypothetical protein
VAQLWFFYIPGGVETMRLRAVVSPIEERNESMQSRFAKAKKEAS